MIKKRGRKQFKEPSVQFPEDDGLPRVGVDKRKNARRKQRQQQLRRWRQWGWSVLALMVIVLATTVWINPDLARRFIPHTKLDTQLIAAQKALDEGYFEGTDGYSARELYSQILLDHPDNKKAYDGLRDVAQAELDEARSLLAKGDLDGAARLIRAANEILGGGADVAAMQRQLREARLAQKNLSELLQKALDTLDAGHIVGSEGALTLFAQVLHLDPNNPVANHGMEQAGAALAELIDSALDTGDIGFARAQLQVLREQVPTEARIPELQARLEQIRQTHQGLINSQLERVTALLENDETWDGEGSEAAQLLQSILALDPGNARALALQEELIAKLLDAANKAMDEGDLTGADALLAYLQHGHGESDALILAKARLALIRQQQEDRVAEAEHQLTADEKSRVSVLLDNAHKAREAGNILTPPGVNAYDLYRRALLIDPNNNEARHNLISLSPHVADVFDEALAGQHLGKAQKLLDTYTHLYPIADTYESMRRRLVDARIGQIEEQIATGKLAAAEHGLQRLGELDPDNERLQVLRERWQKASH